MAVVLNHLWPSTFKGGFIGVDIFFVISGFLITLHLNKELGQNGRIRFSQFWARRIKRLLPAALFVGCISFAVSLLVLPANLWHKVIREFFASSVYVQNWVLAVDASNYFAQDSATTAFRHYWSLSVEEQFYLIWPLLLTCLWWASHKKPLTLGILVAVTGVFSFAFAQHLLAIGSAGAYFNTFTRVWEFVAGALVAFVPPHKKDSPNTLTYIAQILGWAGLFASIATVSSDLPIPGLGSAGAVATTALIIVSGPGTETPGLKHIVEATPVQWIGNISYGIYLWHWPMIILTPLVLHVHLSIGHKIFIFITSLLLATGMKYLIEDKTRALPHVKPAFIGALASVLTLGTLSLSAEAYANRVGESQNVQAQTIKDSLPTSFSTANNKPTTCLGAYALQYSDCQQNITDTPYITAGSPSETPWGGIENICTTVDRRDAGNGAGRAHVVCDFSNGRVGAKNVWVIGDSHGQQWRHAMLPYAKAHGWKLTYWTHGGCPTWDAPMIRYNGSRQSVANQQVCLNWAQETLKKLSTESPDVVLIGNYSSKEDIDSNVSGDMVAQYTAAIQKNIDSLAHGAQVVFYRDTPIAGEKIGSACVNISGVNCVANASEVLYPDPQAQAAQNLGYPVIDMSQYFCPDKVCRGVIGGVPVFYDSNHVSRTYMQSLTVPVAQRLDILLDK